MSEIEPNPIAETAQNFQDEPDAEDLTDAYEALAEDHRRQEPEQLAATPVSNAPAAGANEAETDAVEALGDPAADSSGSVQPAGEAASPEAPPAGSSRRVFMIDAREYPDPDPELPITGARSVQAMYRDYSPASSTMLTSLRRPGQTGLWRSPSSAVSAPRVSERAIPVASPPHPMR